MTEIDHLIWSCPSPDEPRPEQQEAHKAWLRQRQLPGGLRSHSEGAALYSPSEELWEAMVTAMSLGMPLLLTGEPGTGKSEAAYFLCRYFNVLDEANNAEPFSLHVSSMTTRRDLLYDFDAVAYLHAAQAKEAGALEKRNYIEKRPLWLAFEREQPSVVLIDEIDKASRDFPNDLLHVLDQGWFTVPELDGERIENKSRDAKGRALLPIVVITSNGERTLPSAFLRRCISFHIEVTPAFISRVLKAHKLDQALTPGLYQRAVEQFRRLRDEDLNEAPRVSELLLWLWHLDAGLKSGRYQEAPLQTSLERLSTLPAIHILLKDHRDRERLRDP